SRNDSINQMRRTVMVEHRHKRPRLQAALAATSATPSPESGAQQALLAQFPDPRSLPIRLERTSVEAQRLNMLVTARSSADLFYLVYHQLYCVLSIQPGRQLPSLENDHRHGVATFAPMLVKNSRLRTDFVLQCANYPFPIETCLDTFPDYRKAYDDVLHFLSKVAAHMTPLSGAITARGFPPLIEEMVSNLAIRSPMLRHVVHTAFSRALIADRSAKWLEEFEIVYNVNQRVFSQYVDERQRVLDDCRLAQALLQGL
ncbi:hypothetical protein KEM52_002152, partial [Ascosphaera acerosa]